MTNVTSLYPHGVDVNFYEVVDGQGIALWGGNNATEAVEWFRNNRESERILVSLWSTTEEDAHLVGRAVDVTVLIHSAIYIYGKGH